MEPLASFQQSYSLGMRFLAADFVVLPLAFALALYVWPKTPLAKRVFLRPPAPEEIEGFAFAAEARSPDPGQIGRALTPLRPSGTVEFRRPADTTAFRKET